MTHRAENWTDLFLFNFPVRTSGYRCVSKTKNTSPHSKAIPAHLPSTPSQSQNRSKESFLLGCIFVLGKIIKNYR